MSTEEKEKNLLNLLMEMTQFSRQNRHTEYSKARKELMRLYHKDEEARKFIQSAVKSFRGINIGDDK